MWTILLYGLAAWGALSLGAIFIVGAWALHEFGKPYPKR